MYGVFVTDHCHTLESHTRRPEIHPIDAWWWRPGYTDKERAAFLEKAKKVELTEREKENVAGYTGTTYFGAAIDNSNRFDKWVLNGNDGTRVYRGSTRVTVSTKGKARKSVQIVPKRAFAADEKTKAQAQQDVLMRDIIVQLGNKPALYVQQLPTIGASKSERYYFQVKDPKPVCANKANETVLFDVEFEFGLKKQNGGLGLAYCQDWGDHKADCIYDDSGVLTGRVTERSDELGKQRFVGGVHAQTFNGRGKEALAARVSSVPEGSPKEVPLDSYSLWTGAYYRDEIKSGNAWNALKRLRVRIPDWTDAKGNGVEAVFDGATLDKLSTKDVKQQFSPWAPLWANQKPDGSLYIDTVASSPGKSQLAGAMRVSKWLGPQAGGAEAAMATTKCTTWSAHNLRVDFELNPNVANWTKYPEVLTFSYETAAWEDVFKKSESVEHTFEHWLDPVHAPEIGGVPMKMPAEIVKVGAKNRWRYELKLGGQAHLRNFFNASPDEPKSGPFHYEWKVEALTAANKKTGLFSLYPGDTDNQGAAVTPDIVPTAVKFLYGDVSYKAELKASNDTNGIFRTAARSLSSLSMGEGSLIEPLDTAYLAAWDGGAQGLGNFAEGGMAKWADINQMLVVLRPGRHIRLTAMPAYGMVKPDLTQEGGEEDWPLGNGINAVIEAHRTSIDSGNSGGDMAKVFHTTEPFALNWKYEVYELPTRKKVDVVFAKVCDDATAKKAQKAILCKSKKYFGSDTLDLFFPKDGYYRVKASYDVTDATGLSANTKDIFADSFDMSPPFKDPSAGSSGSGGSGGGKPGWFLWALSAELLDPILKNPCLADSTKCAASDPLAKLTRPAAQRVQMLGHFRQASQGGGPAARKEAPSLQQKLSLIKEWNTTMKDLAAAGVQVPGQFQSRKSAFDKKP